MKIPSDPQRGALALAALALLTTPRAQGGPPDVDRRLWPGPVLQRPNDFSTARPRLVVSDHREWRDARYRIETASATACDLVIAGGGSLTVQNARLEVRGDVILESGGLLSIEDSDLELWNERGPRDFGLVWHGGRLNTLRATIGGRRDRAWISNFELFSGLWTATDTTVHDSGGILLGATTSTLPEEQGGTLIANGLFAGEISDLVHLQASGDAYLRNSAFGIMLEFTEGSVDGAIVPLDLDTDALINNRVYGDPLVHGNVTNAIPGSTWRLAIENSTVPRWRLQIFDTGPSNRRRTYRLAHARKVAIGLHGYAFSGSPTRTGPWRTYYPSGPLPELPAVTPPGWHPMPPGCGVRVGPVTIESAPGQTSFVETWSVYLGLPPNGQSPSCSLTVHGPTAIAEAFAGYGTLQLLGSGGFDLGLQASTATTFNVGRIDIRNATVGTAATASGTVEATGQGVVDLRQVALRKLALRTRPQQLSGPGLGVDRGSISLANFYPSPDPAQPLTIAPSAGGTITVQSATPAQNTDLQNLDFEAGASGGVPLYWAATGATAQAVAGRPGSPGSRALRYRASSANGRIEKALDLPAGAVVELYGFVRATSSGSAARAAIAITGATGGRSAVQPAPGTGWTFFRVPAYVVAPGDAPVRLSIEHTASANTELELDDLSVRLPSFADDDCLADLDFEAPVLRQLGLYPERLHAPDFWSIVGGDASLETTDLPPGSPGRQAVRVTTTTDKGVLKKRLTMLAPGVQLTVRGMVKPTHSTSAYPFFVNIGEGDQYYQRGTCNAVAWSTSSLPASTTAGSGWQSFSLQYTVPNGACRASYTTIGFGGGPRGESFLLDDVEVTVR